MRPPTLVSTSGTYTEPAAPSAGPSEPRSSSVPQFGTPPGEVGATDTDVGATVAVAELPDVVVPAPGDGSALPAVDPPHADHRRHERDGGGAEGPAVCLPSHQIPRSTPLPPKTLGRPRALSHGRATPA